MELKSYVTFTIFLQYILSYLTFMLKLLPMKPLSHYKAMSFLWIYLHIIFYLQLCFTLKNTIMTSY